MNSANMNSKNIVNSAGIFNDNVAMNINFKEWKNGIGMNNNSKNVNGMNKDPCA